MIDAGSDTGECMRTAPPVGAVGEGGANVPGLVIAAVWTIALAVGLGSLIVGQAVVAGVALGVAVVAPWLGLAWAAHSKRRVAARAGTLVPSPGAAHLRCGEPSALSY